MHQYKFLTDSIRSDFPVIRPKESDVMRLRKTIQDETYINFISNIANGGFFFNQALQIYSLSMEEDYNDIFSVNTQILHTYQMMLDNEFFFAEDIFGNQFGFSTKGIVFFNIETGEKEYLGKCFDDWIEKLKNDFDYYSGASIIVEWTQRYSAINYNERLCPKIPFVVGGQYETKNLFKSTYPNYLLNNFNIANQVYNLPEGTPIKLRTVD